MARKCPTGMKDELISPAGERCQMRSNLANGAVTYSQPSYVSGPVGIGDRSHRCANHPSKQPRAPGIGSRNYLGDVVSSSRKECGQCVCQVSGTNQGYGLLCVRHLRGG